MRDSYLEFDFILSEIQKENQRLELLDLRVWYSLKTCEDQDPFHKVNYVKMPHPVRILINEDCFEEVPSYFPYKIDRYYFIR